MIPSGSNYPESIDTNVNLFLIHDALRVTLIEDYHPGDTSIQISGLNIGKFPLTGFITLTEQCTEPAEDRALSFYYNSRTTTSFDGLEILPGFVDGVKPKNITNVTQNVMAEHHNSLKDALIAIEEFCGIKGTSDATPLGPTMEGRLNFLRKLVLKPRAWFTTNKRVGIVPMKVTFTDLSFRTPTKFLWDFGDNTASNVSIVSATLISPEISNIIVNDLDGNDIEKIYHNPGIYSVKLTVSNDFGEDTIIFPDLINARIAAPDEATISITTTANQTITNIDPIENQFLYSHLIPGIINARTNTLIDLSIVDNGEQPQDPIISYTWKLSDDLTHNSSGETKASFGIGGYYDIKLRADTHLGAYRITTLEDAINIIERENLFLMTYDPSSVSTATTKNVTAYEFGLLSETFKTKSRTASPVTKDYRFIGTGLTDFARQRREFLRNNSFAPRGTVFSGDGNTAVVYWAEGAPASSPRSAETIRFTEYEAFSDIWVTPSSFQLSRPWNWVGINSPGNIYLLFGATDPVNAGALTNQNRTVIELVGLSDTTNALTSSFYKNGADELMTNVGGSSGGDFSVYRSCYKDSNGYIVRNDGIGIYFRIKSFYKTENSSTDGLASVRKLTDVPGSTKLEGQLVALANGVYFFNNTGEIAVYSPVTNTWAVGGPGASSPAFRSLQDSSVSGFDEPSNTLLATSDSDRRAYLSFDYSSAAFVKFTESDLTFTALTSRPLGDQFIAGVY